MLQTLPADYVDSISVKLACEQDLIDVPCTVVFDMSSLDLNFEKESLLGPGKRGNRTS
jgi:hypothetical protein